MTPITLRGIKCNFVLYSSSLIMNNSKNLRPIKNLNDKQYSIFFYRYKQRILSQSNNLDYKTNMRKLRNLDNLITNILDMSKDITEI